MIVSYSLLDFDPGNPKKYSELEIAESTKKLLENDPIKFISYCNGVGSTSSFWNTLTWFLIPNTVWGINVTPASDLHDVDYSWPLIFNTIQEATQFKLDADNRLYNNMIALFEEDNSFIGDAFYLSRVAQAKIYYEIVTNCGMQSFLSGRIVNGVQYRELDKNLKWNKSYDKLPS